MRQYHLDVNRCPPELRAALAEVKALHRKRFARRDAVRLAFEKDPALKSGGLSVSKSDALFAVRYGRKCDALRALGRLLGEDAADRADFAETARFDMLGIMIDISRNGVLTLDAARQYLLRCSLMGVNMAVLYAEDTYEVPGEPFFGYLRGRYTQEEMKALDDYADALGIEMFPCIQALAHMAQVLQWPAYADRRDTEGVLLAGDEKTYALIDKMIAAASAPFRSKRIHIGMDEAHGIGSGRYRQLNGEKRPFDILNAHLARARDLCLARGLKPMIWSDMYFRLGSKSNGYYDKETVIPADVVAGIPKDVQLVYWDCYHFEPEFYADWIDRHRALGSEPLFAGGVWTWNHFWCCLPFSFTVTEAAMKACKQKGLREAFVTMWGDDGMECDVFSALPGIQFFCEHGYNDAVDPARLRANFRGSCDADLDTWVKAAGLDIIPGLATPDRSNANVGKWLLWQDPLLAFLDPQVEGLPLREHYARLAADLAAAAQPGSLSARLAMPAAIARALSLKVDLRRNLAAACQAGDRARLKELAETDLPALRKAVDEAWKAHRAMWLSTYKPFGLEVLEGRYGKLRTRLESLADRLKGYLAGRVDSIPELAVNFEKAFPTPPGTFPHMNCSRAETPSVIK